MPDRERAKSIIIEILRQSGGAMGSAGGLYKAFYLAHLYFFNSSNGLLSDWPIVRLPHGPGPDSPEALVADLVVSGRVVTGTAPSGPYTARTYRLEGDQESGLEPGAIAAIGAACAFVRGKNASELSDLTHEFSRSWRESSDGDELSIYTDLTTDDQAYQAEMDRLRQVQAMWAEAGPG